MPTLGVEALAQPQPHAGVPTLGVEALCRPVAPVRISTLWVECLRRETAAASLVETGFEAFGLNAEPEDAGGVFPFRHDWSAPVIERWHWKTAVTTLASGNETRTPLRQVPRRSMEISVGNNRSHDALLGDWLADHAGREAAFPLPQYGARLGQNAAAGVAGITLSLMAEEGTAFPTYLAAPVLDSAGVQGWEAQNAGFKQALIVEGDAWQVCRVDSHAGGALTFPQGLARPASFGARIYPLVRGRALDRAGLEQHLHGIGRASLAVELEPAAPPTVATGDPAFFGRTLWPEGNWASDPAADLGAPQETVEQPFADPWVRRGHPWADHRFTRRYVARGETECEIWRARLWAARGRAGELWLADALAPCLIASHAAGTDDGYLRVHADGAQAFWHRPCAVEISTPEGVVQYALASTLGHDGGGILLLNSGLSAPVPAGSRVRRLVPVRLDHDSIEWAWVRHGVAEFELAFRQLPWPRGQHTFSTGW